MSLLYNALVDEARRMPYMELELEPVSTVGLDERLPTGDRKVRADLRLMIKAMADSVLALPHAHEYQYQLERVPWPNSRERAARAANRFHDISLQVLRDMGAAAGEEGASMWTCAARVAEILMEDYGNNPHWSEDYREVASQFFCAMRPGYLDEKVFSELLAAMKES
ncbi:hypothetical protein FNV58_01205 (plasmid) [Streptomyces sp. RLB1-9]|uniref:hypothetical protein n=1 Tax=Streptomyces sp. RLB1-9 TaxID=2594454 RepID=UPI0011653354|nr:hypothetical protein [Streptomyces sp. RLB1-9]QDN94979.1 hypothetical protein FNV58_01205 [Streptomyces sp. RLB1-9]